MPERLYVQGLPEAVALLDRLPARGLAIVGSRSATVRTRAHVHDSISALAGRDLVIVSGFARGTDAAAHAAALAAGLPTVAVLGAGIDVDYPAGHGRLRRSILESGGLIVTEFPPDTPPYASSFHRRNRIIAAWSAAVVVAQAAARSGALNTAEWAKRMGRTCLATPCPPGDPLFAGNQRLIDEEAALPFWRAHSLGAVWLELATIGARAAPRPLRAKGPSSRDADELERVVAKLSVNAGGARPADAFDRLAPEGWSAARFHSALALLIGNRRVREERGIIFTNSRNQTRNRRF